MELINVKDDDRMSDFYRAAWRGDTETLVQLLQRDASIFANSPDGRQTALHISALLGHVPFTVVLLNHNGNLAIREDSFGRTALHLASAEGHIDIVKELLRVNNQPCLNRDREGRIPLHSAAMRGRTEVVQELIMARPDSLSLGDGEQTVFHLCVTYNYLKTLETLVKLDYATANISASEPRPPIFTFLDQAGNTILHLAVMLKRVEVVSYLLSFPEIREIANLKNKIGFTAHDILEQSPKDFKIYEIQHLLTKAEQEGFETDHPHPPPLMTVPPHNDVLCIYKMSQCIKKIFMKSLRWIGDWTRHHEDKWLEEMMENLSLVSTVIATITFQALINPPGGFIQQGLVSKENTNSSNEVPNNVTSSYDPLNCTILHDNHTYCPGQAMASYSDLHDDFKKYLLSLTVSFFSSVSVTLLLVSGIFPMKNKAVIWMLSIGMCFALTFLAKAYIIAIDIIIPSHLSEEGLIWNIGNVTFIVWSNLLDLIIVLIMLRFFIRVMKKCDMIFKKSRRRGREDRRRRFLYLVFRIIAWSVILCVLSLSMFYFGIGRLLISGIY